MGWKKLYCECETIEEANKTVKNLLDDDISAYRQGLKVFIDDGGADDGYSENDFLRVKFTTINQTEQTTDGGAVKLRQIKSEVKIL